MEHLKVQQNQSRGTGKASQDNMVQRMLAMTKDILGNTFQAMCEANDNKKFATGRMAPGGDKPPWEVLASAPKSHRKWVQKTYGKIQNIS